MYRYFYILCHFFLKKGNTVGVQNDHTIFIFHFTQTRQWRAHFWAKYTEMHLYCPCTHDLAPSHGHCAMKIELDMDFIAGQNKIPSSMSTRNVKFLRCTMCSWRLNTICLCAQKACMKEECISLSDTDVYMKSIWSTLESETSSFICVVFLSGASLKLRLTVL